MRSNALRKDEFFDFDMLEMQQEEVARLQIATQAEAACNLPGNKKMPDLEEFMSQYGIASDFA